MNYVSIVVSRTTKFLTALGLGLALAGCMIGSETPLVTPDEGLTPLPATVYLFGYEEDGTGGYKRNAEAPMALTLDNKTYKSADGSINAQFLPLENQADKYLLAIVGPDGGMYGVATYRNNLLQTDIILGDPDVAGIIKAENAPVLADVKVDAEGGGAIALTTREQLDYVIKMVLDGKLKLAGMVMFAGESDSAAAPAKILPDAGWWKTEG